MKNVFFNLVAIALIIFSTQVQAQAQTSNTVSAEQMEQLSEEELSTLYAEKSSLSLTNLGKQCLLKSKSELEAYENQVTDPDLKMSEEEFNQDLAKNGVSTSGVPSITPSPDNCFMNSKEMFALRSYTGSFYSSLNQALRSKQKSLLIKYRLMIKYINSALKKITPYTSFVKRGSSLAPSQIQDHIKGSEVIYNSYTSTSVASGFSGSVRYVILSKSCRYIAPFSIYLSEEEVLCLPGTKFKVVYRNDSSSLIKLLMVEVDQEMDIDNFIAELP